MKEKIKGKQMMREKIEWNSTKSKQWVAVANQEGLFQETSHFE